MPEYIDGRIRKLAENLDSCHVDPAITARVMEGGDAITRKTRREDKAAWFRGAMVRMDGMLDIDIRHAVREKCACCLTGKRRELSKAIARDNATLEQRITAANETKYVFGHSVTQQDDGSVKVQFGPEGMEPYSCPCMPVSAEPMPVTYCYCCGGHVKHHLQTALGRKLNLTVIHTALSTAGRKPCTFQFTLAD